MATPCAARQRGAIGLMAALTLGLAMAFMVLVIDSGRLYLEQRKLQRIADMAALEAAGQQAVCSGPGPQANDIARQAATRNGHAPGNPLATNCGYLRSAANSQRSFVVDAVRHEAIRVQASHTVATSIAAGIYTLAQGDGVPVNTTLTASAVAATPMPPQAMLSIRSTLATVNLDQAQFLRRFLEALGIHVDIDLAGWKGIATTDLSLLKYLDQLAVDLNVKLGDYQQLLATDATLTQLLQAAVTVLRQSGAAAQVITNLGKLVAGSQNSTLLQLGNILDIQNGTTQAGLDASVQLLQLLQGMILLAASDSAVNLDLHPSVLGLINGQIRLKVIEPMQISAIGDPRTDELRVHTAQVRAMISLELPLLNGIFGLAQAVLDLVSPLTNVLNNLLSLNLAATVQSVLCLLNAPCTVSDVVLVPGTLHLDIGLEVAQASSRTQPQPPSTYSCSPKGLNTLTQSAGAKIAIGRFDSPDAFFSQGTTAVKALPLIDIGSKVCTRFLILPPSCQARVPFVGGGIGVRVNSKVLGNGPVERPLVFASPGSEPPNIGLPPTFLAMKTANDNVVASLSETLMGIHLEAYKPTANNSGLGEILVILGGVLDGVKAILEPLIKNLLSPLLDPLVSVLLETLGIDLVNAEVGANLTCSSGRAQLVE